MASVALPCFPDVTRKDENRHSTHFWLLTLNVRNYAAALQSHHSFSLPDSLFPSLVHQYNAPKYKTERKNIYDSFRFEMILSIKHYFFRRFCLEFRIPLHRFADRWPSNKTTWSFTIKNGSPKLYNEQPLSFMPYGTRRSSHQKWGRCKTDYQSLCSRLLQNRNSHYDRCWNVNAPASKHLHNQPRRVSPLVIWESC